MHLSCDKSAAGHMPSVTVILFVRFFEIWEIVESTCNCNLVKTFINYNYNYNYTRTKISITITCNYNYVKICN